MATSNRHVYKITSANTLREKKLLKQISSYNQHFYILKWNTLVGNLLKAGNKFGNFWTMYWNIRPKILVIRNIIEINYCHCIFLAVFFYLFE